MLEAAISPPRPPRSGSRSATGWPSRSTAATRPTSACRTGWPRPRSRSSGCSSRSTRRRRTGPATPRCCAPSSSVSRTIPIAGVTAYVPPEMYPSLAGSRHAVPLRVALPGRRGAPRRQHGHAAAVGSPAARRRVGRGRGRCPGRGRDPHGPAGDPRGVSPRQRARTETVLSIATIGPLGLAAAAIAMVALLLVRRRRATLALARGRGASGVAAARRAALGGAHRGRRRDPLRAAARGRADPGSCEPAVAPCSRSPWAPWRRSCSSGRAGRRLAGRSATSSATRRRSSA